MKRKFFYLERRTTFTHVLLGVLLALSPVCAQEKNSNNQEASAVVSFSKQIAPILVKKCVTCHGPEKSKGGYRLHSFEFLLKPGGSKNPSILPGRPEESELCRRISTKDEDDRMPQKDEPLPLEQIALIQRWVKEGARFDGADRKAPLITLIPTAPHPDPPEIYPVSIPIFALAFSPDGKELAVSGYHEITLWNPANGTLLCRIKGIAQRTQSLAYSPDGSSLAAAGGSPGQLGEIVLLDPTSASVDKVLGTTADMALTVCFSPDATRLAAGGTDNSIHVYDLSSGREQLLIQQNADWVMAVVFNHQGTQIAAGSRDKTARIFDAKTGELETTYIGHAGPVNALAFSPDDKTVYSAGRDKAIHFWSAKDAKKAEEIGGFDDDVLRLVAQGELLYTCSADKNARCHSATERKLLRTYSGHSDWVYALALHDSTKRLATGSHDGEVRIWNTEDGQLISHFNAAPGIATAAKK